VENQYLAAIFARGGSKGLPGKNIKLFNGKPLIAWAIQNALAVDGISKVIVSTDCEKIADIAVKFGAEVPFLRPKELATDEVAELLAWRHLLRFFYKENGFFPKALVSIPTTSPLRLPTDILKCLDCFNESKPDVVITVCEANRNPYFNMVEETNDNIYKIVCNTQNIVRRQDAPKVYDICTLAYVIKPSFIMSNSGIFDGKVKCIEIPKDRSIDIDTALDFEIAEFLHQKVMMR